MNRGLLLVDFGSVWWRQWHAKGDSAVNDARLATIEQIRAMASNFTFAAVCLDHPGPNWRHKWFPEYKGNREKKDELSLEQMRRTIESLRADGFPLLQAEGYEADDVIATLVDQAHNAGTPVTIATADKDLFQLLWTSDIRITHIAHGGEEWTAATLKERLGIKPNQVPSYLALVGDTSDNVPGVRGIGKITATKLLQEHGGLSAIIEARMCLKPPKLQEAIREAYNSGSLELSHELVKLKYDAPVSLDDAMKERVPQVSSMDMEDDDMETQELLEGEIIPPAEESQSRATVAVQDQEVAAKFEATSTEMVVSPAEWERGLQPRNITELRALSKWAWESRLFGAYGTPQAVAMVILAGREIGMGAMAALKAFHIVEGKPTMSAQAMMGLCNRHPSCELFMVDMDESSDKQGVVYVKRRGWPKAQRFVWTFDQAEKAGLTRKNNWRSYPRQMLCNRAIAEAARFTWPEILSNVYTPDEIGDQAA